METSVEDILKIVGATSLIVPAIFFVGLGDSMTKRPGSLWLAGLVLGAAIVGVGARIAGGLDYWMTITCLIPLYQLGIFHVLHALFVRWFGRAPQSAVFNFAEGIPQDRFFSLALMVLATFVPLFSIAWMLRA